jgi:hypothetical protein
MNCTSHKTKGEVVKFLRDLATKLENDELHDEVALQATEFFMKLNFMESCERSEEDSEEDSDVMKFLSLGWYIYTHIIPEANTSHTSPRSYPASSTPTSLLKRESPSESPSESSATRSNESISSLEILD